MVEVTGKTVVVNVTNWTG